MLNCQYPVPRQSGRSSKHRHAISGADLFDVAPHDDVAEFLVQLHGIADATGLFAGNEGRARTAEKGSRTRQPVMVEFMIGYDTSAIGFIVG